MKFTGLFATPNPKPNAPLNIKLPIASALMMFAFIFGGALDTLATTVTFTTAVNTTWTCPAGITNIAVECYGGGGGGGGAHAWSYAGGGGGGSYVSNSVAVVSNQVYNLTVGVAGAAGNGNTPTNGGTGGASYFGNSSAGVTNGALLVAVGGLGGYTTTNGGSSGPTKTSTNGAPAQTTGNLVGSGGLSYYGLAGQAGSNGGGYAGAGGNGAGPGGSGGGGAGGAAQAGGNQNGNPGLAPGGGGGGANRSGASGGASGGLGGLGRVVITYGLTPTATLAVTNSPVTYSGSAQAAGVGVSSSSVPGSAANVKYNGSTNLPVTVGTYAVTADFVPADNVTYNTLTGLSAGNFAITKANPTATLAVNNSPLSYDGNPHAATVVIVSSSTPGYVTNVLTGGATSQTAVGTYAVTADFVPNAPTNYNSLTGQSAGGFEIALKSLIQYGSVGPFTYDGTAHSPTITFTGSTGATTTNYVGVNVSYNSASAPTNAGTYYVSNTVAGDANYDGATNSQTFTINQVIPALSVGNSPVTYNAGPQAAVVNASVAGTVNNIQYNGSAVVPTAIGTYAVTVNFVPSDTVNYTRLTNAPAGNFVIMPASLNWYMSPTGSDTNNGSISSPLLSFDRAQQLMGAGDTLWLRAGTYRQTFTVTNCGLPGYPITIAAYANEAVTVSGCDVVNGTWQTYSNQIQMMNFTNRVRDVFVNGSVMKLAAYPTLTNLQDWSYWAPSTSAYTTTNNVGTVTFSSLPANLTNAPDNYWVGGYYTGRNGGNPWSASVGNVIASSGSTITLTNMGFIWLSQGHVGGGQGYIINCLVGLDDPTEWYWGTNGGGSLYLYPPAGVNLNTATVEARTRLYGCDLSSCSNVVVQGITFQASLLTLSNAQNCVVSNCNEFYGSPWSSYINPPPLDGVLAGTYTEHDYGGPEDGTCGIYVSGFSNVIANCYFAHSWGGGIRLAGTNNLLIGSVVTDMDWAARRRGGVSLQGYGNRVLNNRVSFTGQSAIDGGNFGVGYGAIAHNFLVASNIVTDSANLVTDDGLFYVNNQGHLDATGYQELLNGELAYNTMTRNNAKSPSNGNGIYIDNATSGMLVHHNLVIGESIFDHDIVAATHRGVYIYNNTSSSVTSAGNNTTVMNNLCANAITITGPGVTNNLAPMDLNTNCVNPAAFDYRLLPTSPAIDTGLVIPGITDGYVGSAPDIGAYEYSNSVVSAGPPIPPTYTVSNLTVTVAVGQSATALVNVSLPAVQPTPLDVTYATANGTALAGTSYQSTNSTLIFLLGQTSVSLPVVVQGTTVGSKTFAVVFKNTITLATFSNQVTVVTVASQSPVANFMATPTNGVRPLAVTFTNTSTGSITNLLWNFGDGQTTNLAAGAVVAHTYQTNGTYTVSLKASGAGGSNTNTQAGLVTVLVSNPPQISSISLFNANTLLLQGTGGPTNGGYYYWLRSSTNIALPLTNWNIVATNPFDVFGNFSNQIPLTPGAPQTFYRIQMP